MPFEHHVRTYWEWLLGDPQKVRLVDASTWGEIGFLFGAFGILLLLSIIAPFLWFLIAAIQHGPGEGFYLVAKSIYGGITEDLPGFSLRRTMAVAKVAVQEAIRNRVLVGFAVFVVIMLFGGLFLDVNNSNPARTYISFVLTATNYLVMLMALFLSTFSLPNDIKNKTIYTVVTKPIRAGEIVFGRILGFTVVGTFMLVVMGVISYLFVWRGLAHTHELTEAEFAEVKDSSGKVIKEGWTTRDAHHRHRVILDPKQPVTTGTTEYTNGHFHTFTVTGTGADQKYVLGPARGDLIARAPVFGKLQLYDRLGNPGSINVGNEWTYRGFIEGGNNKAAAVWTFENVTEDRFPNGLPLELNISVFRAYKGNIERGVLGEIIIRNPNPDAKVRSSGPIPFESREFVAHNFPIPRELKGPPGLDGKSQTIDIFRDLTDNGRVEVMVRCVEDSQYFGMAQADVYLRPRDSTFISNFAKGYLSIWLQMVLVTCFGVLFSTFLSGPVAMLATFCAIGLGFFGTFAREVLSGIASKNNASEVQGGGPIESLIRLLLQANVQSDLDVAPLVDRAIKVVDTILMGGIRGITYLLPNYGDFDSSQFVASGYNIYGDLVGQQLTAALVYCLTAGIVAYFFLKTREIAG